MFEDGQRLGEFEILERLGQGGMGAVYKARQVSLDRLVALKTLQASFASDPEYIARFRREAKAAAALNHPNLVQVYSAGENDGLHWFAMEYVEGESAQARVKRKGRLDPAEAIAIGIHIATALEYGWRKAQLIHRDIKPDNIFLSNDGEVKLGDLGLAKSATETISLTMTGASMGTPHYVSPEQGEGKKDVDLRADIYSLGCTLFHLVAGRPPYGGETAMAVMLKHVTAPIPDPQHVWPGFPAELARVVVRMMAKSPAGRQQTYGEVLTDLRRAYDAITTATVPQVVAVTQQPQKPPPPPRPHPKPVPVVDPSAPTMILPVPDAQSAAAPASESESKAQPSKSKPALIAAVAAILGIVAWFAFGKKEPQFTEVERAAKARENKVAVEPFRVGEDKRTERELPKGVWIPLDFSGITADPSYSPMPGGGLKMNVVGYLTKLVPKDVALRMRVRRPKESEPAFLQLRSTDKGCREVQLRYDGICVRHTSFHTNGKTDSKQTEAMNTPRDLGVGTPVLMEIAVIGDKTYGAVNGIALAPLAGDEVAAPGRIQVQARNSELSDIEIMILDGVSQEQWPDFVKAANKRASAATSSLAEPWQDALRDSVKLELTTKVQRKPEGLHFTGQGRAMLPRGQAPQRDGAVRMRAVWGSLRPALRVRENGRDDSYVAFLNGGTVALRTVVEKHFQVLGDFALPVAVQQGQEYELELRIVRQTLMVKLNGEVVGMATDETFTEGRFGVGVTDPATTDVMVKSLEVLDLDAPRKAASSPGVSVSPAPAAETWQDALADPAILNLTAGAKITSGGLQLPGTAMVRAGIRDGAIRARGVFNEMKLRARIGAKRVYNLKIVSPTSVVLSQQTDGTETTLMNATLPQPLADGSECELELRAVGQTLSVRLNGAVLGEAPATFLDGTFGIGTDSRTPVMIKKLEFLRLTPDAPVLVSPDSSATPAAATKDAPPVISGWQDVTAEIRSRLKGSKLDVTEEDGWLVSQQMRGGTPIHAGTASGNTAMRVRFRGGLWLNFRMSKRDGKDVYLQIELKPVGGGAVQIVDGTVPEENRHRRLTAFPIPPAAEHECLAAIAGSELRVWMDGALVSTVHDETVTSGRCAFGGFAGKGSAIHDLAVAELPPDFFAKQGAAAPSPATATKDAPGAQPSLDASNGWQSAYGPMEALLQKNKNRKFENGWLLLSGNDVLGNTKMSYRNGVIRLKAQITSEKGRLKIGSGISNIELDHARTDTLLNLWSGGPAPNAPGIKRKDALPKDAVVELMCGRVGTDVFAWLDGQLIASRKDEQDAKSPYPWVGFEGADASVRLQDIEVLVLDGVPVESWPEFVRTAMNASMAAPATAQAASNAPGAVATATKAAPFVNSLGMKFVPVPIGGGPTNGQRVLFGVWDVRVQDYAAYAAANPKADGSWKTQAKEGVPAGREPEHPVVGVSWEDAQAFCQWLTEKESAEGKLPKGLKYRLPSDEEWSWAVGMPPELSGTPEEKNWKNSVDFPWGKDYPPTRKVGNYADETFHAKFPKDNKDKTKDQPWIQGYTDGYATTSPVGSFPANAYGLYDMGGNVWQWCEDWWNAEHKDRVLRGASWDSRDRGYLLSSTRRHNTPGSRYNVGGFRCVLAGSSGVSPAPVPAAVPGKVSGPTARP